MSFNNNFDFFLFYLKMPVLELQKRINEISTIPLEWVKFVSSTNELYKDKSR